MSVLLTATLCALVQQDPSAAAQEPRRPEPLPIPRTGVLRRGERRIIVDGSLQDWPALPPIGLDDVRQVSGTALGAFRSLDDLAGKVFLLWDEEDLYVAARVLDDWHIALRADSPRISEIPPADSLLLTFDPLRDSRAFGMDPGRSEDAEFWLAEVAGQERRVVRWDRLRGSARFAEGATAIVMHEPEVHTTTYEARIPWREILPQGRDPEPGLVFDLQIVLNDYDEATDPMPQTRVGWNFGMGPRIDPWLLGSAVLLGTAADEFDPSTARLPAVPAPPEPDEPPVPGDAYWIALNTRIERTTPTPVTSDVPDAAFAGGRERHDALLDLEGRLAEYPRVDFLEFQQRIHRRMNRECAGIVASGLPYYWDHVLDALVRRVAVDPPESGFRLFRLPQGGWVVRSREATFAIDPTGYRIDRELFDVLDFVLLTRPLEITERNDQLLSRMAASAAEKPVFTQVAMHLPGIDVREIPLVVPGETYEAAGLSVHVFGERDEEGLVSRSVGYQVSWPDGTDLVVSGVALAEEQVKAAGALEALLLSARHPRARIVGQRLAAGMTVLDDVLECSAYPGALGRVTLQEAFELQDGLRPHPSLILAPGESIEIGGSIR